MNNIRVRVLARGLALFLIYFDILFGLRQLALWAPLSKMLGPPLCREVLIDSEFINNSKLRQNLLDEQIEDTVFACPRLAKQEKF